MVCLLWAAGASFACLPAQKTTATLGLSVGANGCMGAETMSAMKQLESVLMECPLTDLTAIFVRRMMMGTEVSQIPDNLLHDLQTQVENEIGNRLVTELVHVHDQSMVFFEYD